MKLAGYTTICCFSIVSLLSCSPDQTEKGSQVVTPSRQGTHAEEAFPNQQGTLQTAYFNKQKINYRLINGQAVFERDMILYPDELEERVDVSTEGTGRSKLTLR